jgi:hypothetical protein
MEKAVRRIANIAVSVFTVIVGLGMWLTAQGVAQVLAFVIILVGVTALETNIVAVLKRRHQPSQASG